jgi:hypothetical protein
MKQPTMREPHSEHRSLAAQSGTECGAVALDLLRNVTSA